MGEQEFYVYVREDQAWFHGTCWERMLQQRRHPTVGHETMAALLEDGVPDQSMDISTFDAEDDTDEMGTMQDEGDVVYVQPEEFAALRGSETDLLTLEQYRCRHCSAIMEAPSLD